MWRRRSLRVVGAGLVSLAVGVSTGLFLAANLPAESVGAAETVAALQGTIAASQVAVLLAASLAAAAVGLLLRQDGAWWVEGLWGAAAGLVFALGLHVAYGVSAQWAIAADTELAIDPAVWEPVLDLALTGALLGAMGAALPAILEPPDGTGEPT